MAVAGDYSAHAAEVGLPDSSDLVLFARFPSAVIGPEADIVVAPDATEEVDYETELAVVIGATAGPGRPPRNPSDLAIRIAPRQAIGFIQKKMQDMVQGSAATTSG